MDKELWYFLKICLKNIYIIFFNNFSLMSPNVIYNKKNNNNNIKKLEIAGSVLFFINETKIICVIFIN